MRKKDKFPDSLFIEKFYIRSKQVFLGLILLDLVYFLELALNIQ